MSDCQTESADSPIFRRGPVQLLPRETQGTDYYGPDRLHSRHVAHRNNMAGRRPGRERASTACDNCRSKKLKCEGRPTCVLCRKHGTACNYSRAARPISTSTTSVLLGRIAALEAKLTSLSEQQQTSLLNTSERSQGVSVTQVNCAVNNTECGTTLPDNELPPLLNLMRPTPITVADGHAVHVHTAVAPITSDVRTPPLQPLVAPSDIGRDDESSFYPSTQASRHKTISDTAILAQSPHDIATYGPPQPVDITDTANILPLLDLFLKEVFPLFPIICGQALWDMATEVAARGFQNDLLSCIVSFAMLLAKAWVSPLSSWASSSLSSSLSLSSPSSLTASCSSNSWTPPLSACPSSMTVGLRDLAVFTKTTQLLSSFPTQLTIEYAQSQVLCSMFFLRQHKLLDSWHWLHAGCTTLYAVIRWQPTSNTPQTVDQRNNLLRMFWVCLNMERDINHELCILPCSQLASLASQMELPLGCDNFSEINHWDEEPRLLFLFFLAETALKEILARINSTDADTSSISSPHTATAATATITSAAAAATSPVTLELRNQLATWESSLPPSLDWSPACRDDARAPLYGTRLRLHFWLAHFRLCSPLLEEVVGCAGLQLTIEAWTSLMHGLTAGYTLVQVLVLEQMEVDWIMGKSILSVISILERAASQDCLKSLLPKWGGDILDRGRLSLEEQLQCTPGRWPWEL